MLIQQTRRQHHIVGGGLPATTFVSTWNTAATSSGSSSSTQVQLPTIVSGTYNYHVDWGDASSDDITVWNDAARLHTYSGSGTYEIQISGQFDGFTFEQWYDRLKLVGISQWGTDVKFKNHGSALSQTANFVVTATDKMILNTLTSNYFGASAFAGTGFLLNMSACTKADRMFAGCSAFNAADAPNWQTGSCTDMYRMFYGATSFDRDISAWDVTAIIAAEEMFSGGAGLSTANYDALLIGWEGQAVKNNVLFHAGTSKYTGGGAAATARAALIADHTWTITDGGIA